jgi:hypothetical protein
MRHLILALFLSITAVAAPNAVIRLAPDLSIPGIGDKARSLKSLRGQSVVLVIAESPRTGEFRKQVKYLGEIYEQFASKGVVFIAALKEGEGPIKSDIPFAIANNGPAVAGAYGVEDKFNIAIIGRDGNIDYQTDKVLTPERVRDVIQNSFSVQTTARKP